MLLNDTAKIRIDVIRAYQYSFYNIKNGGSLLKFLYKVKQLCKNKIKIVR